MGGECVWNPAALACGNAGLKSGPYGFTFTVAGSNRIAEHDKSPRDGRKEGHGEEPLEVEGFEQITLRTRVGRA